VLAFLGAATGAAVAQAPPPPVMWEQWRSLPGVLDVVGPRPDGAMVAAAGGKLFLVARDGTISPFGDYSTDPAPESYLAMVGGDDLQGPGCRFEPGDVYALQPLTHPLGLVRVTASGQASRFAELDDMEFLGGIAFDGTGRFGHRLLVVGQRQGRTAVVAVDCRGATAVVTDSAPLMEGGIAVAPDDFGAHGGELIGADELSGDVVFVRADGRSGVLAQSGLPAGQDVGVESVGFLPADISTYGGSLFVADRRSGPTDGTDSIWRLGDDAIRQAGLQEGDLVVATEKAGRTVAVRCRSTCRVLPVGQAGDAAHVEGHVTAVLDPPKPPLGYHRVGTITFVSVVAFVIVAGTVVVLVYRRKPSFPGNQPPP
jgi:hypothetical protein